MPVKQYKSNKRYKCPYCEDKFLRNDLITHVEKKHKSLFPEGYDAIRVVYDAINKTDHGKCMICGKPVYEWDSKHYKYKNLCDNPRCREEVRKIALQRHIKVYNKPSLLDDPEHQEKMLARRKISGSYTFTDGGTVNYTGKYERNALEFIDKVMNYKSSEIECPGPVLTYEYNGETHNYISDIFIIPANLLIEVKDGGKNPNNRNMPEYRAKQIAKEEMITKLGTMNYLRLTDNQFGQLLAILADIKLENLDNSDNPAKKYHINESFIFNEAACPSCGGGVPASCATIPRGVNIATDSISANGELGPFIFSAPDDDECTYFDGSGSYEIKKKKECGEFNYLIEVKVDENHKINDIYNYITNTTEAVNLKHICRLVTGKKPLSLMEMVLSYQQFTFHHLIKANTEKYVQNGISSLKYSLNESVLRKEIKPHVNIAYCEKGYFAFTDKYPFATTFRKNKESIRRNEIETLSRLYNNYENMSK